jgi:hypothetical protein
MFPPNLDAVEADGGKEPIVSIAAACTNDGFLRAAKNVTKSKSVLPRVCGTLCDVATSAYRIRHITERSGLEILLNFVACIADRSSSR